MTDRRSIADTGLSYRIRRSRRARRGRIVVRPSGIEVVAPVDMSALRIHAFVQAKSGWVQRKSEEFRRQVEAAAAYLPERYANGATILYRGAPVRLRVLDTARRGARVTAEDGHLVVTLGCADTGADPDRLARDVLQRWFRTQLRGFAQTCVEHHAPRIGVRVRQVRIKNQRHIWGSCGPTGIINLNWRLACAPARVFEYVVVHELCHLVHRNHSRAFWALVACHHPEFQADRHWLREHDTVLSRALT